MTTTSPVARFGSGKAVRRIEDDSLLTGRDQFADNFALPGQAYLVLLRSPHAHARIAAIDVTGARALPGVLAVYTGAELVAAGVKPIPASADFKRADKSPTASPRAARAGGGHRALRGRGGGRGGRRIARGCARCGRGDRRALRAAGGGGGPARRRAPACAAGVGRGRRQHRVRGAARQARSRRAGTRQRGARGHARPREPARGAASIEPRATLASFDAAQRAHHAARELPDADGLARRAVHARCSAFPSTRCACWSGTWAAASA